MNKFELKEPRKVREQILAYLAANDDEQVQYLLRLHAMLLVSQPDGPNTQQVADLYGMNRTTVGRWVTKLNKDANADITVLKQVPKPGRNTRADKDLLKVLKRILRQAPKKVGIEAKVWTGNLLSQYLKQNHNIELKPRMCQRWMRRFELEREEELKQKAHGK